MIIIGKKHLIFCFCGIIIALVLFSFLYLMTKGEKDVPEVEQSRPSTYGEFISWKEVDKLFPRYSKATIIDLKTWLRFDVQRRGGDYHADVQPLTAEDTFVMQQIFNYRWTWDRRPVIILLPEGRRIAGSMNGMPHGPGAIKGNNFNGHFCVHFKDSKVHKSNAVDMSHQIMVWKAANVLDQQLNKITVSERIKVFFAAVDQREINTARKLINNNSQYAEKLLQKAKALESIKIQDIRNVEENAFEVELRMVYWEEINRQYVRTVEIHVNESKKIEPESVISIFEEQ